MELDVRTYGTGRPIVLLHGVLGSKDNWHSIAQDLSEAFCVYVPDLRNHGESPHSGTMTYPEMAADVVEMMDRRQLEEAVMVGHSMGGKVAMETALTYPGRVASLVVEDMVPGKSSGEFKQYLEALMRLDLSVVSARRDAERRLENTVGDRALLLFLLKNLKRTGDGTYRWIPNLDAINRAYDEITGALQPGRRYNGPSLFIRGSESKVVGDDRVSEIYRFFPEAELKTIQNAGHWVHGDAPDEFVRFVRAMH